MEPDRFGEDPVKVRIRWAGTASNDLASLVKLEAESGDGHPAFSSEKNIAEVIRPHNVLCMIADRDGEVVGYAIYMRCKKDLQVLRFLVSRQVRRRKVGTQLVAKLIRKTLASKKNCLNFDVDEGNLEAQLFLRSCGIKVTRIIKASRATSADRDWYFFQWCAQEKVPTEED